MKTLKDYAGQIAEYMQRITETFNVKILKKRYFLYGTYPTSKIFVKYLRKIIIN